MRRAARSVRRPASRSPYPTQRSFAGRQAQPGSRRVAARTERLPCHSAPPPASVAFTAGSLAAFHDQATGLQIWAEGPEKSKGRARYELQPAEELVIYSSPPSPQELRAVLETVKPVKVHLFAVSPPEEKTDGFLSRLAGLAKFVINQRAGKVTLQELAGVAGQREKTVQIGLEWLAAGGHISIESQNGTVQLSKGKGEANPYLQKELFVAVRGILEETARLSLALYARKQRVPF